jgi:RNA polymerase sigma-70 factor (ECF subfamily)
VLGLKSGRVSDATARATITGMNDAATTIELLERARAGDDQALNVLFARHLPELRRWASGRLPRWARDLADTTDLVQETLLQTFKRIDAFEPRSEDAFRAYLRQAVMNRVRDELRRHRRRPEGTQLDTEQPDEAPSPLDVAIAQQAMDKYEQALSTLNDTDRDAVVGRVEMGLSYAELADMLDKPTAEAARKTAQRALVKLAEAMNRGR